MKKSYNKPEILNMETICPDQAIAGCIKGPGTAGQIFLGWGTQWDAGSMLSGDKDFYDTEADAKAANRGAVCACYFVWNEQESVSYEDYADKDGNFTGVDHPIDYNLTHTECNCGETKDWLQDVKSLNYLKGRFLS